MDNLFKRYQKELVRLANNPFGRRFLDIPHKEKIIKVTPNSYHFINGSKITAIIRCYPLYARKLAAALSSLEILNTLPQYFKMDKYRSLLNYSGLLKNSIFPQILLVESNLYSSAGDGDAGHQTATSSSWAICRAGAGTVSNPTSAGTLVTNSRAQGSDQFLCYRGFLPFITSGLGSQATVTAAVLNIYGLATTANPDGVSLVLILTTQASISTLANSDYANVTVDSPAEGASRFAVSGWSVSAYNQMTLNATGRGWINITGNTLLGLRDSQDVDNTIPVGNNEVYCHYSEETGTSQDPYLQVSYTVPVNPGYAYFM